MVVGIQPKKRVYEADALIWFRGAYVPRRQVALVSGCTPENLRRRYASGVRGPALWAPATRKGGLQPEYRLGLNGRDWSAITAYARERGAEAARQKFGIPFGAVRCALDRMEERLT